MNWNMFHMLHSLSRMIAVHGFTSDGYWVKKIIFVSGTCKIIIICAFFSLTNIRKLRARAGHCCI